ncbi:hypothetical protein [Thermococcus peptonophilus]|uniref:Uncharacterized protein n=1 Tax=Thermococcus peptonophilus TaxID=53952 RepID=A0A142CUV7_9EURY|nr:hypothetical protein [Thermococcus peptonophilus]AMQ18559.1 hypothetical protein A0127_04955 [Thermococcus peptonophilus]
MPAVPQSVPTDRGIILGTLGLIIMAVLYWALSRWMDKYAERKERELEEEMKELEDEGKVY